MQMWWPLQTILLNWYTVWKIISHSHLPATSSRNLLQISNFHCGRAMDIYKIYYNSLWMKILNLRNDGPWNKTKFLIGLLYHPGKCCFPLPLFQRLLCWRETRQRGRASDHIVWESHFNAWIGSEFEPRLWLGN